MSVLLVLFGVAVTLAVVLIKGLAVDEVRGRIDRRIADSVEATIAALPAELQDEWAEEWRAELAAVISMPITAGLFARGLRHSASELVAAAALEPAQSSGRVQPQAPARRRRSNAPHVAERWFPRVTQAMSRGSWIRIAAGIYRAFSSVGFPWFGRTVSVGVVIGAVIAVAVVAVVGVAVAAAASVAIVAVIGLGLRARLRWTVRPRRRLL